jgi:outer membrane protein OmpA-like peptidoglycan-associated protein
MNLKFVTVSVVALALFAGPGIAQQDPAVEQPAAEQPAAEPPAAEQPAAEQPVAEPPAAQQPAAEQPAEATPPAIPDAVLALLNDRRSSQELGDAELKQRVQKVRKAYKTAGLPDDVKAQLQAMVDSDRAELETRVAAKKPVDPPAPEAAPAEAPAAEKKAAPEQPAQTEQQAQPEAAPAPVAVPDEVTQLLNDGRSLDELNDEQLVERSRTARALAGNDALPDDVRQKLKGIDRSARKALAAREQQAIEKKKTDEAAQPTAPAPKVEEQAQQPVPAPAPDAAPVITEPPPETKAADPAVQTAPPAVDKADVKQLDGNAGDPEAEKRAQGFLDDATPAASLTDEALRARLDGMRDLMAENELSIKTERALREKLRAERDVLRDRVAKAKAEEDAKAAAATAVEDQKKQQAATDAGQPLPKKDRRPNINIIITADTPIQDILRDRRDVQDMDESEVRYRIRARRDFEASQQYRDFDEEQRVEWQNITRRDREFLRGRLEEDRNIRRRELDNPRNIRRIVIEDDRRFDEEDLPEEVFAAEVDDTELERVLLAPPRKKIVRRISVEQIASQPDVRKSMSRIDVDTIRFGFNEAFVREEEVDSLDKIASVIEKVLKKYPREVFLIEGHTDAVGSNAYNDTLSKARAEAVKKALSTYYIIPGRNLKTVGLGERYLKIPTAEAEQENRRVSISRATAVIGEAEQ